MQQLSQSQGMRRICAAFALHVHRHGLRLQNVRRCPAQKCFMDIIVSSAMNVSVQCEPRFDFLLTLHKGTCLSSEKRDEESQIKIGGRNGDCGDSQLPFVPRPFRRVCEIETGTCQRTIGQTC
jgi:hypothetical protein